MQAVLILMGALALSALALFVIVIPPQCTIHPFGYALTLNTGASGVG